MWIGGARISTTEQRLGLMFDKFSVPLGQLSLRNDWVRLAMTAKEAAKPGGLPGLGLRRKFEPGDVTVLVERDEKISAGWCVDPQTVRAVGDNAVAPGISVGADDRAAVAAGESGPPVAYCVPDHCEDLSHLHLRTREQHGVLTSQYDQTTLLPGTGITTQQSAPQTFAEAIAT